jgi:hypothetical protein
MECIKNKEKRYLKFYPMILHLETKMEVHKMRNIRLTAIFAVVTFFLTVTFASAGLITFETTPGGGTPGDDTGLTAPYAIDGGYVSFGFYASDGTYSNALFEEVGGPQNNSGFWNSTGYGSTVYDTANPGFENQLGNYFLRQPDGYKDFGIFRIQYSGLEAYAASGEIWDIDGGNKTEQYSVTAYGLSGQVLQTLTSPLGNNLALDGLPWVFNFTGLTTAIDHIDIDFTGTKTGGIGLAFNNFSATSAVPIPGAIWLLGSGLLGLVGIRRRNS